MNDLAPPKKTLIDHIPIAFSGLALIAALAGPAVGQYTTAHVSYNRLEMVERRVEKLEGRFDKVQADIADIRGDQRGATEAIQGIKRVIDNWNSGWNKKAQP